jgi:hypothetical protein
LTGAALLHQTGVRRILARLPFDPHFASCWNGLIHSQPPVIRDYLFVAQKTAITAYLRYK